MMRFLVLLCLLGTSFAADTVVLNEPVDQIIKITKALIALNKMDTMSIPGFSNEFDYNVKVLKGKGRLTCEGGYVKSLLSIQRTGDATLTKQPGKFVVNVKLGFGYLAFGFSMCNVNVGKIGTKAKMDADVKSNSVDFQVSLTRAGNKCIASVDHVKLDQLGAIKIKTGVGLKQKIESNLLEWATHNFRSKIVDMINQKLQKLVADSMPNLNMCKYIPAKF